MLHTANGPDLTKRGSRDCDTTDNAEVTVRVRSGANKLPESKSLVFVHRI